MFNECEALKIPNTFLDKFSKEVKEKQRYSKIDYKLFRSIAKLIITEPYTTVNFDFKNQPTVYYYYVQLCINGTEIFQSSSVDNSLGEFLFVNYYNDWYTKNYTLINDLKIKYPSITAESLSNVIEPWANTYTTSSIGNSINTNKTIKEEIEEILKEKNIYKGEEKMPVCTEKDNFYGFKFGPAPSNLYRLSPYGLACYVKDKWITYNSETKELVNVDIINFDMSNMIYFMPVAISSIQPGDILIHQNTPVFVRNLNEDGTVCVVDYQSATVSNILPVKSPFGFNFYTKVTPLINFNDLTKTANSENPFGNILPFLLMREDSNIDPMMAVFMMNNGVSDFMNNPMLMYLLMKNKDSDMWPIFFAMNQKNFN